VRNEGVQYSKLEFAHEFQEPNLIALIIRRHPRATDEEAYARFQHKCRINPDASGFHDLYLEGADPEAPSPGLPGMPATQ